MNKKTEEGIVKFFEAVMLLQDEHVIHSKNYANDIYELISKDVFGYDNIPVVSNNCPHNQPCRVNRDLNFEIVIIVLGPVSNLKLQKNNKEILLYKVSKDELERSTTVTEKHLLLTKDFFINRQPTNVYKLD
jgi:hypothetical protein